MNHKGLLTFIFEQKKYKWLLLAIWTALVIGILSKTFLWKTLRIDFLIFFVLTIPIGLLIINVLPYSFYSNWIKLCEKFGKGSEIKRSLKVHIKNFDPWKDLAKHKTGFNSIDHFTISRKLTF